MNSCIIFTAFIIGLISIFGFGLHQDVMVFKYLKQNDTDTVKTYIDYVNNDCLFLQACKFDNLEIVQILLKKVSRCHSTVVEGLNIASKYGSLNV